MEFNPKYPIIPRHLTSPSKRRPGLYIAPSVRFIVAHDTGNPGSSAAANVRYYQNSRDEKSASAHLFVDDKEIIECIPALTSQPEKAWHVLYGLPTDNRLFGVDANDAALGVEYCYGGRIQADEAYRRYVWVMAYCCHRHGLDPKTSVIGHFFLDPNRKTDPVTGLAHSRRTYEQLLRDIVAEYAECTGASPPSAFNSTVASPGKAITSVRLHLRRGAPTPKSNSVKILPPGSLLNYVGWVEDGAPINGNSKWYQDTQGDFFWSGGVVPA